MKTKKKYTTWTVSVEPVRMVKSRPRKNQSQRSDSPCHIIINNYSPKWRWISKRVLSTSAFGLCGLHPPWSTEFFISYESRTDMELRHLFFDSTVELSRQGYFQWIYSLRAAGTPEITVRPCFSFSGGNPQNDNSPKSR